MFESSTAPYEKELLACRIVCWLRQNYRLGKSGSLAKEEVYGDYVESLEPRRSDPVIVPTYFGKLVKKAFPSVRCNRKGPRGKARQHYTHLQRVDHEREAQRERFHSASRTDRAADEYGSSTTQPSGDAGVSGVKHEVKQFRSYISSELSYLNYLLKKTDAVEATSAAKSAPATKESQSPSLDSAGASKAPTRRDQRKLSLQEAELSMIQQEEPKDPTEGEEREWDWVFVSDKLLQKPRKQHPKPATSGSSPKRQMTPSATDCDSAQPAAKRPRVEELAQRSQTIEHSAARQSIDLSHQQQTWQERPAFSDDAQLHHQPQNFFRTFVHRSPSSSPPSGGHHSPSTGASCPSTEADHAALSSRTGPTQRASGSGFSVQPNADRHESLYPPVSMAYREPLHAFGPFFGSSPFTSSSFSSSSFSSSSPLSWPQGLPTSSSFVGPSSNQAEPYQPSTSSTESVASMSMGSGDSFSSSSWHSLPSFYSSTSSPAYAASCLPADVEAYYQPPYQPQHQHAPPSYQPSITRTSGHQYQPICGSYLDPQPMHSSSQHSRVRMVDEITGCFQAGTPGQHLHHHQQHAKLPAGRHMADGGAYSTYGVAHQHGQPQQY